MAKRGRPRGKSKTTTAHGRTKFKIKRPGALTKAVGGKPSKNMTKVRRIAKTGTPLQKKQANFYLNVLRKRGKKS